MIPTSINDRDNNRDTRNLPGARTGTRSVAPEGSRRRIPDGGWERQRQSVGANNKTSNFSGVSANRTKNSAIGAPQKPSRLAILTLYLWVSSSPWMA